MKGVYYLNLISSISRSLFVRQSVFNTKTIEIAVGLKQSNGWEPTATHRNTKLHNRGEIDKCSYNFYSKITYFGPKSPNGSKNKSNETSELMGT